MYTKPPFPEENSSYKPAAAQVAAAKADLVVLGSTDVPTVAAFMAEFEADHYTPKMFIAAAGPDQGAAFTSAVKAGNAQGMMVPNGWYPGYNDPASQKMVSEYVAQYKGTASGVNADVAEAYSVGQVVQAAIIATGGTDNQKIISYLHSAVTLKTRAGRGEVRLARREQRRRGLHLPVAAQRLEVPPGAPGRRGVRPDHRHEAGLGGLTPAVT